MCALRRAVLAAAAEPRPLPEGGWTRRFCFAEASEVFAGHFPGRPVLPAVVQILLAQATLEQCVPAFRLFRVPQAKFLAPLGPGVEMELRLTPGRAVGAWECVLQAVGGVVARFRLEGEQA